MLKWFKKCDSEEGSGLPPALREIDTLPQFDGGGAMAQTDDQQAHVRS